MGRLRRHPLRTEQQQEVRLLGRGRSWREQQQGQGGGKEVPTPERTRMQGDLDTRDRRGREEAAVSIVAARPTCWQWPEARNGYSWQEGVIRCAVRVKRVSGEGCPIQAEGATQPQDRRDETAPAELQCTLLARCQRGLAFHMLSPSKAHAVTLRRRTPPVHCRVSIAHGPGWISGMVDFLRGGTPQVRQG